jgi:hypothetical protein
MSKGGGGTQYMFLPQASSQSSSSNTNQTTNQQSQNQSNQVANSNTTGLNLSNTGSSQTSLSQIPQWLEDAARAGVGSAQNMLNQPVQAYTGDLTAGLNQYQQQAGNMFQNAVDQFSPYFDQARSTIQSGLQAAPQIEAQTLRNGLSGISDYMNPYIQNVVDNVSDISRRNLDRALTQTADQAISARAFGGSRQGVQEGVAVAQNNRDTNNLIANLLSQGYDRATSMLGQDVQNNLTAQQGNQSSYQNYLNNLISGGGALAGLGSAAQNSLNTGIGNLLNFGNLAQGTEQNANTAAYNEWMRQQGVPLQLQQLYNQTLSAAPHSTMQSSTGQQTNTALQSAGTNATQNTNSNSTMSGNTQGSSNTNSSGFSMSPMQQQSSSPLMQGLGGLMGLGSMFAAPAGGVSAASGLGSALMSGLSLLSDKDMKTDVKKLGKDEETGLDIYSYRYKGDPKTYPKVVGPMAQDIEKHYPGATERRGDRLTVHPGAFNSLAGKFAGGEASARGLL